MATGAPNPSLTSREIFTAWGRILTGRVPLLSIEITRECPLSCPGCYAYGDTHLGGGVTLSQLSDFRGDALVDGVLDLVRQHKPMHVSLVGGEPLVRHRELSRILPALGETGVFTLVVTSAVIPIPAEWMKIPRVRVAVSVDGLPEDHDIRRKPATYERILQNIAGREVNIHWVITRPMLARPGYLEEYVAFWSGRDEVNRIWVSVYTPQIGEQSVETLTPDDRAAVARQLPDLAKRYPKLLFRRRPCSGIPSAAGESFRLRVRENVDQLLSGPEEPRRTLRLRRHARLLAVRMRDQHRPALGQGHQVCRPSEDRPFHRRLIERWPLREPRRISPGPVFPMASGRQVATEGRVRPNSTAVKSSGFSSCCA